MLKLYRQNKDKPSENIIGNADVRKGIAFTFTALAPFLQQSNLIMVFNFLVQEGLLEEQDDVKEAMQTAGIDLINEQGKDSIGDLMKIFESYMTRSTKGSNQEAIDRVRQSVGIFLGALAKHMDSSDPRISKIADLLLDLLRTPSEPVQKTISKTLIPLMPALQATVEPIIASLLEKLKSGQTYSPPISFFPPT